jgi:hypothetical protein
MPQLWKAFQDGRRERWRRMDVLSDVCVVPAALPTGERLQADQATIKYTDGNMNGLSRTEYIKLHGIDPMPVWEAVKAWREEQIAKWKG